MREWVKLRESYGVEGKKKFESLRVWGQPSAWADSVMQCWLSDLLAEYVPQCITVCDCFQGQWTPVVLHTSWFNQQFQIPVGPDVTPLLQLADVAVIAPAKSAAESKKEDLQLLLHEVAKREQVEYSARFGKYEIFEVASHMASYQTEIQQKRDVVLAMAVQTQSLALRPDESGQLVKVAETSLGKQFPSTPLPSGLQESWVGRRWVGLTSNGPVRPDWESLTSYLEPTAVPAEPEENALVLHVASRALHEELSHEEATLLQGPVKLWESMVLPPQLASQKPSKRAPGGVTKWGMRLAAAFSKGRSTEWLARLKAVGAGKPAPRIAKKGQKRSALDADREDAEPSAPKKSLKFRVRSKRAGSHPSGAVKRSAKLEHIEVEGHALVSQRVRVVGEGATSETAGGFVGGPEML